MGRSVSVIVPTYGRQGPVEEAILSATRQSHLDDVSVEVIVVDDASPTPIEAPASLSVQTIRHPSNRGVAAARNTGVQAASGELIAFLDSDDVWLPNKLANQVALFEQLSQKHNPDLLVVGSGFYDPNRKTGSLRARTPMNSCEAHLFASGCWFAPGSSVLMSRKAFELVGPQDETMRRLEDLDWFIRFGAASGKYFSTDTHDVVIRPSGNAPFDAVMTAVKQLTSKYGPSGSKPLPPHAWNRLAAYLSLEKAVAGFGNRNLAFGTYELVKTILRKPRMRPALESFWVESAEVPSEVEQIFAKMLATHV